MSDEKQPIDHDLIRRLAELLRDTDLTEIEVEHDDLRVRVVRQASGQTILPSAPPPVAVAVPGPVPAPVAAIASPAPAAPAASESGSGHPVPSPMVGTAYLSPKPGDPPFVAVGDTVREGQTLMIIEAMKHMNQIPAPRAGKVLEILVEDSVPVEYGETLVILGPS